MGLDDTLTVPHHGLENNFRPELLTDGPSIFVVAADSYRKWRHPATSVVQAIASAGAQLAFVTASDVTTFSSKSSAARPWWSTPG